MCHFFAHRDQTLPRTYEILSNDRFTVSPFSVFAKIEGPDFVIIGCRPAFGNAGHFAERNWIGFGQSLENGSDNIGFRGC